MAKDKINLSHAICKINPRWTKDLNVKVNTLKLSKEHVKDPLHSLRGWVEFSIRHGRYLPQRRGPVHLTTSQLKLVHGK